MKKERKKEEEKEKTNFIESVVGSFTGLEVSSKKEN